MTSSPSNEIIDSLKHKLTFNQISLSTFSAPSDVTLKLSDGSIDAHKMILAAVSPVFERMFYGDFKEAQSRTADLPADSYKVIKLLVDLVYSGTCKPDSLDDILPLNEVMDRYQMRKNAFYHMCGEVILTQLNPSNYVTLLPKFVCVLNEENTKKAADKVMCYTSSNFIDKFDDTRNLPEEILLLLLQRDDIPNPELDIFNYLINWHDYQTKELNKTLNVVPQLFQSVRYFLINPHLLHTKVAICPLVDKQLLKEAIDCLYEMPSVPKLKNDSNCKCGECDPPDVHTYGRVRCMINICTYWKPIATYFCNDWVYKPEKKYEYQFNCGLGITNFIQLPQLLKNGAYVFRIIFSINKNYGFISFSLCITADGIQCLYVPIKTNDLITMLVYNNDICFKITDDANKVSVYTATETKPCTIDLIGMGSGNYSGKLEIYVYDGCSYVAT